MTQHNVEIPTGDTAVMRFSAVNGTGDPIDLTGAQIVYAVAPEAGQAAVVSKSVGSGITVVSPTDGIYDVTLDPADTDGLGAGTYYHESELTEADGRVSTILTGDFVLEATSIP